MSKHEIYHLLVKTGTGIDDRLIGAQDDDRNFILSLGDGELVKCTTDDTRQLWRHRKFFLLLTRVIDYMSEELSERYPTPEKLLIELKLQLGYMDVHVTLEGREVWTATNSISFAAMGEAKFKRFVNECRDVILKRFLPDITEYEFDQNFMSLIFD